MSDRTATIDRQTKETAIRGRLALDGKRRISVTSGIGFLDHMLTTLAFHAGWDLMLECEGDLEIDDHHTAEDCALALGGAVDRALGDRAGIARFGSAHAPLDEALARAVVDLSGRPWPEVDLGLRREMLGSLAAENVTHVLSSMAMSMRAALHVDVLRGANDHHRVEAAFKALALALKAAAARLDGGGVPSTKGFLDDGSDR
jgi:imidazoleglycerol phosphate dehydratase HisB